MPDSEVSIVWLFACNGAVVLDLNRAFSNNALQLNPQFETAFAAARPSAVASSLNFNEMLASVQAESQPSQSQNETASSFQDPPYQSATSLLTLPSASFISAGDADVSASGANDTAGALPMTDASQPGSSAETGTDPVVSAAGSTGPTGTVSGTLPVAADNSAGQPALPEEITGAKQVGTEFRTPDDLQNHPQVVAPAQTLSQPTTAVANALATPSGQAVAEGLMSSAPRSGFIQQSGSAKPSSLGQSALGQSDLKQTSLGPSGLAQPGSSPLAGSSQKVSLTQPTIIVAPGQETLASSAPILNSKSADKAKANKESATTAGGVVSGTDPATTAFQSAPSANVGTAVSAPNTGGGTSASLSASRTTGKAGSNSDLAFALKIQGNSPTANATDPATQTSNPSPDLSAPELPTPVSDFSSQMTGLLAMADSKAAQKAGSSSNPGLSASTLGLAGTSNPSLANASLASGSSDASQDVAAGEEASSPTAIPDEQPAAGQLVKALQVQITGDGDQKVDLKLVEKSGALMMSVRSSDASLTKALQQNLPDLTTKLNDQQIRAEWWRPDSPQAESSANSGTSSTARNDSTDPDQANQNKGNSGQQGGRGTAQPDWLDDLATSRKSNQNGTQFSWHL
jgi:hypothetical protein